MIKNGVVAVLQQVLDWSRERNYAGYSKHDALNSRLVHACTCGISFLRLVATQIVMRFPFNIRPLVGVPKSRNPKGIGLFAYAWLDKACLPGADRAVCVQAADDLLTWLIEHASPQAPASGRLRRHWGLAEDGDSACGDNRSLNGLGWGYHYPWQDQGFFQPRHYPNRVVTSWIGFSLLRAFEETADNKYLLACEEVATFLTENPRRLQETDDQVCLSYVPLEDIDWAVMDVSALVAAFLARFLWNVDNALQKGGVEHSRYALSCDGALQERKALAEMARRLMLFVVDKQTEYGGWFYTYPAKDSHIKHDNYHTAIILDCLADYMFYCDDRNWEPVYRKGLDYYREALFLASGAPCWMNDRAFPHDIHGAASGILCFTRAAVYYAESQGADAQWAKIILRWTLKHLYNEKGFFYYQRQRFYTKRFCLMRWGNAWMSRALAQYARL
ncbi:MAG: hypothetical protein ACNA71_09635 [Kiritimatiellia bacterium]